MYLDGPDADPQLQEALEALEAQARPLGLYVAAAQLLAQPTMDGPPTPMLFVDFQIGDVAWSDRVQHPEKYETDTTVATMEKGMHTDEFLEVREAMKRRVEAGLSPIGPDEEHQ